MLIAGGESQYVEFKREVPTGESRKKMARRWPPSPPAKVARSRGRRGRHPRCRRRPDHPGHPDARLHSIIRDSIDPEPPYAVRAEEVDGKTARGGGPRRRPLVCDEPSQAGVLSTAWRQHSTRTGRRDRRRLRVSAAICIVLVRVGVSVVTWPQSHAQAARRGASRHIDGLERAVCRAAACAVDSSARLRPRSMRCGTSIRTPLPTSVRLRLRLASDPRICVSLGAGAGARRIACGSAAGHPTCPPTGVTGGFSGDGSNPHRSRRSSERRSR
jgi:hypothetical protein